MLVSPSPSWASGSSNKQAPPAEPGRPTPSFFRSWPPAGRARSTPGRSGTSRTHRASGRPAPTPRQYTALLKAAYRRSRRRPERQGRLRRSLAQRLQFIEGAYAAGAKGYFDVMATHPYSCRRARETASRDPNGRISQGLLPRLPRGPRVDAGARRRQADLVHGVRLEHRRRRTCGVSEATQADYLTRAFKLIEQDPYVEVALWYNLRNNYWTHDADDVESRYGLIADRLLAQALLRRFQGLHPRRRPRAAARPGPRAGARTGTHD